MEDKKDQQKEFSTCLEDFPFTESVQKMESRQGVGSLIRRFPDDEIEMWSDGRTRKAGNGIVGSIMKLHRCADCPIRHMAAQKPRSLFARIHCWHMTWWPGWKIFQAEMRTRGAGITVKNSGCIEEKR